MAPLALMALAGAAVGDLGGAEAVLTLVAMAATVVFGLGMWCRRRARALLRCGRQRLGSMALRLGHAWAPGAASTMGDDRTQDAGPRVPGTREFAGDETRLAGSDRQDLADDPPTSDGAEPLTGCGPAVVTFTPRQRQLLHWLAKGLPDKVIAREMGISKATVRYHFQLLFEQCGIHDRAAVLGWAIKVGWRDEPDAPPSSSPPKSDDAPLPD
jgi:DNA-binding CsgD family transcriptional regulator